MTQLYIKLIRLTFTVFIFSLLFMFLQLFSNLSNDIFPLDVLDAHAGFGTADGTGGDDDDENFRLDMIVGEGCDEIKHPKGTCSPVCTIFVNQQTVTLQSEAEPGFVAVGFEGDPDCMGDDSIINFFLDSDNTCTSVCVPFLNQIPLLASLFSQTPAGGNVELLILITPTIINNVQDEGRMVEAVAQEIEGLQNVVVVITLPEGVIVNSASVNGDEEACEVISDTEIECTIEELTEETEITLNVFVPDLGGELLPLELSITTDSFPGVTLEQVLNIVAGTDSEDGGNGESCTLAKTGSSQTALILIAFLPALFLFRRLIRK